ncbi:transglutaminase domain-containing protein [Halopseudomonas pachastrellae]|nr:transglutaminase domain-containing protein [Halopseudomonas pachastrellae]
MWSQDVLLEGRQPLAVERSGAALEYQVIAQPTGRNWLYSLPGSVSDSTELRAMGDDTLRAKRPLSSTFGYTATAFEHVQRQRDGLPDDERQRLLQLPEDSDPRSRAWAEELRQRYASDAELVNALLRHFNQQPFHYTLRPPTLGRHSNDEFLFDTRRGFCEHYAGAMTFVLRAAGIPARVVTGYQGGELNPRGGYLLVHQFDAHAWIEAWLPGRAGSPLIRPFRWPQAALSAGWKRPCARRAAFWLTRLWPARAIAISAGSIICV